MAIAVATATGRKVTDARTQTGVEEPSCYQLYSRWFDVVAADTPELRAESYRLRYQVYCVENAFESPAEHPDGFERDEYDDHSEHSLLIHRETGAVVGTVRLILPAKPKGLDALPISQICKEIILQDPAHFPPNRTAEISRFAVSKSFRRRVTDGRYADLHVLDQQPRLDGEERRVLMPNITLGLMQAVVQMSLKHGITHLCAVMEPALLRLVARLGIRFRPLGPLVDYHGRRQPCCSELENLVKATIEARPDTAEFVRQINPELIETAVRPVR